MKSVYKLGLGVAAAALAASLVPATVANADPQAQSTDIVGVGSDTVQYLGDFIADGSYAGRQGWNNTHLTSRIANYEATGDAFGGPTTGRVNTTVTPNTNYGAGLVERAGTLPVARPDGSGTGYDALNNDTNGLIDFVRASSAANTTRQGTASTAFGGFHAFKVSTDDIQIATAPTTNVPALTKNQLQTAYSSNSPCPTINSLTGSGSMDTIRPLIPQAGSGTRNDFLNNLFGSSSYVPGNCTTTVQEHDPAPIAASPDAFGPFSVARNNLINKGYFANNGIPANAIALQGTGFPAARPIYIVTRENNLSNGRNIPLATVITTLFGTLNDSNGPLTTGAYTRTAASRLYTDAGFTPTFQDCDPNATTNILTSPATPLTTTPNNFC